jgi:hypothetical protein
MERPASPPLRASLADSAPSGRPATSWLPWVLVAISLAVAVTVALLK